jgi:hypothetical protein
MRFAERKVEVVYARWILVEQVSKIRRRLMRCCDR